VKHVSILIPEGKSNISSIDSSYKVLTKTNEYLIGLGKEAAFTIQLVGNSNGANLSNGFFSVHSDVNFKDVRKTDLIIIPAIDPDIEVSLALNKSYLPWIVKQYKQGAEIASICV